jgi:pyruvate/2-oxoglutarate dehydrogenase complex dihydrolipoamide acyltransferase (E2) component
MATPVRLPPIATDTTEGTLARWLVRVGDAVDEGQVVAEVDTAKVLFEVQAPAAGVVLALLVEPGEDIEVGDVLAWVGEPGEAAPSPEPEPEPAHEPEVRSFRDGPSTLTGGPVTERPDPERVRAAPVVRRLAERLGVDLGRVAGSGPDGRILSEDVERAAAEQHGNRA